MPPSLLQRVIRNVQLEWDYETSALTADHDNHPERGILPKEVYGEPTPIAFEGTTLMGVANPDAYLRCCYGNYMEIPDEIPKPSYRYMNLHKPYLQYREELKNAKQ